MSTNATPRAVKEPRIIKIDPRTIDPSPFQSRKIFDPAKLGEMVESVREHGVIQPPLVRAGKEPGRLELIVGERRVRACVALELPEIQVLMSEVTDAQAEGMVLTENIQREGLTPAEEAHAFARLLALRDVNDMPLYTQAAIAHMIGKDDDYVTARLKLLLCPAELVTAVNEGLVKVSTAMLVGRVPDPKARAECAKLVLKPTHQEVPLNYQQTKELIREQFMMKLSKTDFDLDDPGLVPVKMDENGQRCQGGACADCPFRSGKMEGVDLAAPNTEIRDRASGQVKGKSAGADAWLCTLPRCHRMKLDAAWRRKREAATAAGGKVLDEKEAKKVFSGRDGDVAWDSKLVPTTGKVYLPEQGYKEVSSALKGPDAPKVILAQHPDTKKVVELVEAAEVKAFIKAKASKGDGTQSPAEARAEAERKEQRAKELRQQKLDKIALEEGVNDLREAISTGRLKLDERFFQVLFETALGSAGSDGLKFLADTLKVEREKKLSGYELDKPLKKWAAENCTTVPQLAAVTVLAMLGKSLHWSGTDDTDFRAFLGLCGVKVADLERRARALLDADKKGKAKQPVKAAVGDSTNPIDWTTEKEAIKTKSADKRAKTKERRAEGFDSPLMNITVGRPGPEWLEAFDADKVRKGKGSRGTSANAADYAAAAAKNAGDYFHCDKCGGVCAVGADLVPDVAALPEGEFQCEECSDGKPIFGTTFALVANQEEFEAWQPAKAQPAVKKARPTKGKKK